jgi:hypothetical protein
MAEVSDKDLKKIQKMMNDTISDLLYGGSSDAGWAELAGSATCFKILQILGLKIKDEKEVRTELEGENIYDENFLE